jgi:hypothetical protein
MIENLKKKLNTISALNVIEEAQNEDSSVRDMYLDDTDEYTGEAESDPEINALIDEIPEYDIDKISDADLEKIIESTITESILEGDTE